ncbi:Trafficking protein particle complex subunit 9 [Schistosoma japonicum]|nr:Trafficking protein particle complex subunit 9 [Schistosoma japonicum]
MFAIDFEATFLDHRKITLCLTSLGPDNDEEAFNAVYCSLMTHYSYTFVRSGSSKNDYLSDTVKRNSLSDTSEVHSDIGISGSTSHLPIWLRFLKEYNPINNAWSCFQSYRATLGMLAFAWCSSHCDIESRIKDYTEQKKLLSGTLVSSHLFLLLKPLNAGNVSVSLEEANNFVSEKLKEDPVLLREITCHPSEHLFVAQMNIVKDFGIYAATDECSVLDRSHNSIKPYFINHRISSVLQEIASEIYWNLKNMLTDKCSTDIKFKKKELPLPKEQGDFTDDILMTPEENESKWNIIDEVKRKALGRTNALSAFTDRTGPTSAVSAQADVRFIKQKRATGRSRKYLGDVFLQLGDLEMAQIQYNLAIEHLKPINDNLWIAGALEGLCAVAMCQHSCDQFSNLNIIHPKFLHHRDLEKLLASNQLKKSYSQESDMSEHSTASSLDLASSKSQQPLIISSTDCCNYALETIELYNKVELNPYLFEEFKFKVVRLFISESQKRKACEILDSLVEPSLKSFSIESACSMKRYLTIARLYKSMNFNRKASLALWLLFTANPSNYLDFEHEILLNGLKIQSPYSSDFAHTSETKLPDTNDDTIMNTSTFNNNFTNTDNKELTCVLHGNQPPVNIIHRLVSCPPLWSPFIVLNHLHWLTHITTNSSMLSTNALSYIIKLKSVHNMTRQMNNLSTNSNLSSLYSLKSCLPFRSVGWYELQLKVMLHLINECKRKINLEDIAEISWDIGLKLIGKPYTPIYCFSVLDSWPDYIQKTSCISCMDDLCRLAVLRCPDLPTNLPSMTLVNYSADGKISVHSRRWPRNRRVIYSHGLCYLMYRDNDEAQMKVTEKQMLDLVEIPVHQLPLVRLIDIPSLPSHLLPHTLSKNAAENVVSLSKGRMVVIRPDRNQAKQFEVSSAESSKSAGLFVYNPFQTDNSSGNKYPVIDWICEEPAYIELIVDNKLPIDLRISDLHVELMPINTVMNSSNRVSSSTSDYESLFGGGCITNGCSGISNLIRLEAVCLIVETSQSVKILPTTHLSNHYFENMRHHTNKNGFSGCLENSCLLEEADLHRQFPNTNTECFWRKTILDVNCKLPSHTSRIKLSIGVVPTVDMLISNSSSEDSNIYVHYRVVGITYRLVDCGGMRVYLRPPRKLIYSLATFGELSNRGGGREKHSSGSSSSTLSTVRSSWNVGSEPIGSSNGISGSSEFDSEHILSNALGIQFLLLPLIRLQPPMPRMCIFPGRICSAFDLHEAMDILEKESSAKYPCTLSEQLHSLGLSKFHVPDPSTWSNRVAAVLDLTIFPYETRWLPIELYIRDENRLNVSTNNNNSDSNFDFDSNCSVKRYLNVLHVNLKSVSTSLSFLTKLNLTATDFVQCVGLENLRKKVSLNYCFMDYIENNEIPNSLPNISSDYDERSLPLYATHVGVIWLKFDSDKYWQIVTSRFSSDPDLNELMKTVQVQSIYIQLEMEYALDAIKHTPSSSEHNSSSLLPNQSLARQISLGFKLKLLSSNLAPLKLSDLMLTFEDETPINEYYLHNKRMAAKSVGEKIHAQSFLYGSIETNLSDMFLPEISIKPEQLLDYRLEIELNEGWSNEERQSNSIQLTSPWLTHVFH